MRTPRIGRKFQFGRRMRDPVKGFMTNEARLVKDDFGDLTDPRTGKPDIDWRRR